MIQLINNNNYSMYKIFFFLTLFALILRLGFFIGSGSYKNKPIQDPLSYHRHAVSLVNAGVYGGKSFDTNVAKENRVYISSSTRPPGLPFAIAGVYKMIGSTNYNYVRVFMIIISSLSAGLLYIISINSGLSNKMSLISGLVWGAFPTSIYYSVLLLSENLALILMLCIVLLLQKFVKGIGFMHLTALGFLLALLALTRSVFLLLPFLLGFILLLSSENIFVKIKKTSFLIITFVITMSPWVIRNYILHDDFVPVTSRLGYVLYICNNDLTDQQIINGGYARKGLILDLDEDMNEIEKDKVFRKYAQQEILNNLNLLPRVVFNRLVNTLHYKPNPYKEFHSMTDYILAAVWIPIFIFSFIGMISLRSNPIFLGVILAPIVYVVFFTLPFWGFPRFRFPVDPLFVLLAIFGLKYLISKLNRVT
jgi:4-amino-4-deoxy-L-arabinose transferase-like glycosyltransferase